MRKKILFFLTPTFVALTSFLFFISHNINYLSTEEALLIPIIIIIIFSSFFITIFSLILFRNLIKSSLLSSYILIILFNYGHFNNILTPINIKIGGLTIGPDKILIPLFIFTSLLLLFSLIRFKTSRFISTQKFIATTSIVLFIILCLQIIYSSYIKKTNQAIVSGKKSNTLKKVKNNSSKKITTPDVYYFILDSYPREDILKDVFNFNNEKFISALKNRGFYIADHATSNYAHTHLSIPSFLNLKYLNDIADKLGPRSQDIAPLYSLLDPSLVEKKFSNLGYKYIFFPNEWRSNRKSTGADIVVKGAYKSFSIGSVLITLDDFLQSYLSVTILKDYINNLSLDEQRGLILYDFEELKKIPSIDEPKFIYAHFIPPHPPFLFDSQGKPADIKVQKGQTEFSLKKPFVEQLLFMNKKMLETIDSIIDRNKRPSIIIIHADHGTSTILGHPHHWSDPIEKDKNYEAGIEERMPILMAVRTPDQKYKNFYSNLSPVNVMRLILNDYFNDDYELLPDKNYFSSHGSYYDLKDVTDLLK